MSIFQSKGMGLGAWEPGRASHGTGRTSYRAQRASDKFGGPQMGREYLTGPGIEMRASHGIKRDSNSMGVGEEDVGLPFENGVVTYSD